MKIFDYTDLRKGFLLDCRIFCGQGEILGYIRNIPVHNGVRLLQNNQDPIFFADEWKRDYVFICSGKWRPINSSDEEKVWEWIIVPSKKIAEKGVARNLRKFGTTYYQK
jgi:hypothetical protein